MRANGFAFYHWNQVVTTLSATLIVLALSMNASRAAVTQNGADAVLTLTGGSITFVGVQAAALTAGDFVIV